MSKYHFCFAIGQADFMPAEQYYHSCDTIHELREIAMAFVKDFKVEHANAYVHFIPTSATNALLRAGNASMLSQRLCIARDTDWTLDLIGMTESEFNNEMDAETCA
jgi:hypothetical protein